LTVGRGYRPTVPTRPAPAAADPLAALRERPFTVVNRVMEVHPGRVAAPTKVLRELGFTVTQVGDGPLEAGPDELVLLWGNAVWFPQAVRSLEERTPAQRPTVALWHVEPLPPPRDSSFRWPRPRARELAKIALRDPRASDVYSNWWALRRLARHGLPDVLAVPTRERSAFLAERGLDVHVVPYGYEEPDGRDLGLERDLDVLFLGVVDIRARRRAVETLRRAGIRVETQGDYRDPSLWGESRTQLINRAKIMLSISRFPGTFGSKRFLLGMSCNALMLSDPLYDPSPFERDVHFVERPVADMPAAVEHYLEHEDERRRIAQAGHDLVTGTMTMRRSVERLIALVGKRVGAR
jgi:hypothetical protein